MNRITRLTAALLVSAAAASPALAAPQTYVVDSTHTFPSFSYSHFGMSIQMSKFDKTTGTVTLDKEAKSGAVEVTIDMKSVSTGYAALDEHIQGEDFLDTAKYPTATFKSTKVSFDGDKPATIDGELTIKGVTKPVTLKVNHFATMPHPMLKKDAIGANATAKIKRSEFNAGKYAPYVSDDVTLIIALEAIKP